MDKLLKQIDGFLQLDSKWYCGFGVACHETDTVHNCDHAYRPEFISKVKAFVRQVFNGLVAPPAFPMPNGGVSLEWTDSIFETYCPSIVIYREGRIYCHNCNLNVRDNEESYEMSLHIDDADSVEKIRDFVKHALDLEDFIKDKVSLETR